MGTVASGQRDNKLKGDSQIMRTIKSVAFMLALSFVILSVPMSGLAQDATVKVILTFNQPIALPHVTLAPGTYMFRTTGSDDHTLQVLDSQGEHLYDTVLTTSTYVSKEASKTTVTFDARSGAPRALKTLIPANQKVGRELVY